MKLRRILLTLLVLCLTVGAMVMTASAAEIVDSGSCGENLTWTLDSEGTLTISGTGDMYDYDADTTAPWYECDVQQVIIENGATSVGKYAFYSLGNLTSITLPDSVTSLGKSAFSKCYSLTDISIPDSVTSLGAHVFHMCESLTSITIPDGVTKIGTSAFYNCFSLSSITLPNSVTSIGKTAFFRCYSLGDICIPDSVTSIGTEAFYECDRLTSITIGDGVTSIGDSAFYECTSLTSITIPDSVTSIGDKTFRYCSSLTSITLGEGVTSIGTYAFYGCNNLTSIEFGDGVTKIGGGSFEDCSSLTSITIPDSVTSIGDKAFRYCSSLTSITLGDGVTSIGKGAFYYCDSVTSITFGDSVTSIGGSAFRWCEKLTEVTLPDSVTDIGDYAFGGCTSLTSITIPDSVTDIGDYAFGGCTSLTSITLGEGVTSIGEEAFSYCTSLTSITIPDSVTSIGKCAFSECTSLTSITIPGSVTEIGATPFLRCDKLSAIYVDSANQHYTSVDGVLLSKDKTQLLIYPNGKAGAYSVPAGVTSIGASAFSYCTSLTSITIPDSVTSIGNSAFEYCSSLASITLREGVTSIGEYAFYGCSSLTSITFPKSVKKLGANMFGEYNSDDDKYDSNLEKITFNGDAPKINSSTFEGVEATAYYPADNSTWTKSMREDYGGDITWKKYTPAPLSITTQPKTGYAKLGEKAKLTVKAEGDGLTYQWYVKDVGDSKYFLSSIDTPSYSMKMTENNHGRRAYCVITDAYGNSVKTKTVYLRVSASIATQPKNTYTKLDKTAKVSVKAVGDELTYQWYIKNAGAKKYSKSSVTSATYSCKMTEKSKDRYVYCIVTDKYGNTEKTKTVVLRMAATITTQPNDVTVAEGKTAKVTVKAVGDELTYQWYIKKEGASKFSKSSVTKASYSVKMSEKVDGRQVYCVVTDKYGKTVQSNIVTLAMK